MRLMDENRNNFKKVCFYLRKTFHDRNVLITWNYNNIVKEMKKMFWKKSAMNDWIKFLGTNWCFRGIYCYYGNFCIA